jgi:two-component system sensor histidine kinase DegS
MSQTDADLSNFLNEAAGLLSASQQTLQKLAEQSRHYLEKHGHSGEHSPELANIRYLYEQASQLVNQSRTLSGLLNGHAASTPLPAFLFSPIQILQRQEEERARTAKDLEDSTAQLLANAIFELAAVKRLINKEGELEGLISGINALQQELEQGLADLRFFIAELEPSSTLGNFGLVAGLRRYLEKFSNRTGIETALEIQTLIEPLPNTIEIAIFRIIQEALQNTQQHARASRVQLIISEENNRLQFQIIDNGIGLNPNVAVHNQRRLGLVGMKDIADMLAGELQIKSSEEQGTEVVLTIPYPQF